MPHLVDVKRQPIIVNLKDKEYELLYSLEAFAQMEENHGSVDTAMAQYSSGKIASVKEMLYLGFIHLDNPPTMEQIGKGIDIRDLKKIMAIALSAIKLDGELEDSSPN